MSTDSLSGAHPELDQWFMDAVNRLVRADGDDQLGAYIESVGNEAVLESTHTRWRCHFLARDGNGRPHVQKLARKLAEQVVDYCIPRSRIREAQAHLVKTQSTDHLVRLNNEARGLFTSLKTTGEGGEMLLYLLLERILGAPQLLCKMSLKTNSNVHFHGVDGVHVKALPNQELALYWGEAKMHKEVNSALDSCFAGIAPYLLDEGSGASHRDIVLARDNLDTGDETLSKYIGSYFLDDNEASNKRVIRGATLVGFDLAGYPLPYTGAKKSVCDEVAGHIASWQGRVRNRVVAESIQDVEIELFCLPFPSIDVFRNAFLSEIGCGVRDA